MPSQCFETIDSASDEGKIVTYFALSTQTRKINFLLSSKALLTLEPMGQEDFKENKMLRGLPGLIQKRLTFIAWLKK